MEEEEYIQLQNLLTKYRVCCMKMYGNMAIKSNIRESNRDQIGIIDNLRKKIVYIWNENMLKALKKDIENGIGIKSIVTHQQFNSIKYEVK